MRQNVIRSREILFMKQRKQERVNERERERERTSIESERSKESHLERVHALPVLVQVVHEIHIFLLLTT